MLEKRINDAFNYIKSRTSATPKIGLILGSGLGVFVQNLENTTSISFKDLPDFPVSTIEGHEGAFVFGEYEGHQIVALNGRIHYYEGYSQQEITMPVRIMKKLGVEKLILTNAAGGVNLDFSAGALMLIKDHINYSGANPLIGKNLDEFGVRFPDATDIYTKDLREKLKEAAAKNDIKLFEGVYVMYSGPNYETPAEIRFFRSMGGDAVGMSTVPEALVAAHSGIKVIGMSCITNMAAGVLPQKLNHLEVMKTAERVREDFTKLLKLAIII